MAAPPSELERSMESLVVVFHRYADEDGDGQTLTKKEFKKLLENELPTFLATQKDPDAVSRIMQDLDEDGDNKLNFKEFVTLVLGIATACEKYNQLQAGKD